MRVSIFLLFLLMGSALPGQSQELNRWDIGLEIQIYPTGVIPGIRSAYRWTETDEVHIRLGYQFIDHRGLGVQAEEAGSGWGFTLGYRHYLKHSPKAWTIGVRNDLWWNTIEWNSGSGSIPYYSGTTRLLVLQPTAELAYTFLSENGDWSISPNIAFGYELNAITDGEPTGEGAILLIGIVLSQRF